MKVETLLYRLTLVSGGLIAGLSSAEQGDFSRMNTGIDLPSAHSQSVMIFEYENRHQVTPELPKVFARSYPQEIARSGGTSNSTKSSHVACVGSGCRINNSYSRKSSINSPTGIKDIIFANSFEGFSLLGGTISGHVFYDPNFDGVLLDGVAREGVTVYLDANYNGQFDDGELTRITDTNGFYEFNGLPAGVHHVRQLLQAPNVQTFPESGPLVLLDGLADEVFNYTHSAPGVGNFDVPYGKNASDWPGEWSSNYSGPLPLTIDSPDLVLKPIGVRNIVSTVGHKHGTELITLPLGSTLTVRFDEAIIDGPGADFLVYSPSRGTVNEMAEVLVGPDPSQMTSLGIYPEGVTFTEFDLQDFGLTGPVHYLEVVAQDLGGSLNGFELVGFEAINFAPPNPGTHVVIITPQEYVFRDRDFGRFAQDIAPTVTLGITDNNPGTPELRAGESITVQVNAVDDVAISTVELMVNGQPAILDMDFQAVVMLQNPGEVLFQGSAADSIGQTTDRFGQIYVTNADGSPAFDPNLTGQSESSNTNAPQARILTPSPGANLGADVDIIASITGPSAPISWVLEYALVDDIDPYNLAAADVDYNQIGAGSDGVVSSPVGTMPLSSLADGIYFIRLSAQNSMGQSAYYGQVLAKNVPETDLRPEIIIDSPDASATVSMTVDIVGSINSTRPLVEWFVEYALASSVDLNNLGSNAPDWKRIAEGTSTIPTSAPISNFDGTLLRNNSYIVRIVAKNNIGLGWVEPLLLEVTGDAKLGRNRLEFDDLSIDLAGFPLRFVRVYDSIDAELDGELGFGWSLQLQDTDIGETVPDTGVLGLFGSTPFRVGTRVYVTAPTGERLGFTFQPQLGAPTGQGQPYFVVFDPDPGNYHTLEVPEGISEFIQIRADGNAYLFPIAFPYNPERYVLVTPNGTRYTIHEDRGMLQAQDLNGNSLTFNSNAIEHSAGPQLQIGRDGQGRIIDITDPEGNAWLYDYDANGDLESFSDPDGNTSVYTYLTSPAHFLDTVFDPQGRMARRSEYDPLTGRLVAVIDENGNRRESNLDPQGFIGTTTDARGNVSIHEYDGRGNVTMSEDPLGNQVNYQYNDLDNPDRKTRMTDSDGEEWDYLYDAMGRPTRLTPPLATLANQRYSISYDAFGNITQYKDPAAHTSNYTYDPDGNRLSEEPAVGKTSTFVYGSGGQLQRRETTDEAYSVTYAYDANGLLQSQTDPTGYDLELISLENGRLLQHSDNNGTMDVGFTLGGLLNTQLDQDGNTATLVENIDGSITRTDRNGNATSIGLDADGRPTAVDLPSGGQVLTSYDADGNPEVVTDPLGNALTYAYDVNSRLVGTTDQLANSNSISRDAHGNITEMIDRNGKRRTFVWDADRRITFERWHDGGGMVVREFAFIYNALRGLIQVDDTIGGLTYTLDYNGRLPQVNHVDYILPGQEAWRVRYTWSNRANTPTLVRAGIVNTTQSKIDIDTFGGQSSRLDWDHPGTSGNNNIVEIRRNPDSTVQSLRRLTGSDGGDAISQTEFTYDSQSRIMSIRHEDDFDMLLHAKGQLDYTRDAEGRLLSESDATNRVDFSYDDDGQLTAALHSDVLYTDENYSYDIGGNRLTSHLAPATATISAPNRVTASGDFGYEYDNAGNLTRRTNTVSGAVTEFTYDHRNRLILGTTHASLGAPADDTLEFEYDYLDRMLYRVVNGIKTWVLHDRDHPVAEFEDAATTLSASFLYDPAATDNYYAAWRTGGAGERWFLKDQLGSVRGIADAAFNVLSWVDYDGFGNLQPGSVPAMAESYGFAGRPFIDKLGLSNNSRRFYDPLIGRFTQEDPTAHGGRDHNFYRYALNNPTGLVDPSGEVAMNTVLLVEFIIDNLDFISDGMQGDTAVTNPCKIASWSASNFAYFDPLAELILNPTIAASQPVLDPVDLFELTGCVSK